MRINTLAAQELVALCESAGRSLQPSAVVDWARENTGSALHACFEWDDTKAAQQFRLQQAGALIRIVVTVPDGTVAPVRVFVSLQDDRGSVGYRRLDDVLTNPESRSRLVEQFLREMQSYEVRYRRIAELAPIFAAVDKVRGSRKRKAA